MSSLSESQIITEMLVRRKWDNSWADLIDCEQFIITAINNKVLSTLAHFIFENDIEKYFKNTCAYSRLIQSLLVNKRDIEAYTKNLHILNVEFAKNGIDLCLLKGLSLRKENPRDMGDLDILIHQRDLEKVVKIVEDLGYSYVGYIRNDLIREVEARDWEKQLRWNNQFQFLDPQNDVLVEIHSNLFERRRVYPFNLDSLLENIDNFWKRTIISEHLRCRILSPEDRFWLLSMHNSIRRSATQKSFVLRNILDMINLINSEDINWNTLFEETLEKDCLVFIVYSLEMINIFLTGFISEDLIRVGNQLLTAKKKIMKRIMHSCYRDVDHVNYFMKFLYKLILPFVQKSSFTQKLRSLFIFPVLFSTQRRLRQIYRLPKESILVFFTYFLEPIRWFLVAFRELKERSHKWRRLH